MNETVSTNDLCHFFERTIGSPTARTLCYSDVSVSHLYLVSGLFCFVSASLSGAHWNGARQSQSRLCPHYSALRDRQQLFAICWSIPLAVA